MRKPLNTSVPEELISRIDEFVVNSRGDYRDRSHLVEQAIKSYLGDDLSLRESQYKITNGVQNISPTSSLYETSLFPRLSLNANEKRAIAEQAVNLIGTGETLFIDGSTTCIELAKVLAKQKKRLTIVTNSALICLELGHSSENMVIGVGGEFDPSSASFVGRMSEETVEEFYVDYAFFSTKGFFPTEGTFESSMGLLRVKQVVARHCAKVVLLVDYSKFGQRSLCKVLDISQIHSIVTDAQTPQEAVDFLRQTGHEVQIAYLRGSQQGSNGNAA
jgi:DeoR/GlpR family transcriptional regulator of sugar metabolism